MLAGLHGRLCGNGMLDRLPGTLRMLGIGCLADRLCLKAAEGRMHANLLCPGSLSGDNALHRPRRRRRRRHGRKGRLLHAGRLLRGEASGT